MSAPLTGLSSMATRELLGATEIAFEFNS